MGIASAGVDQGIDTVDNAVNNVLEAIEELENAALAAATGALVVGDKTFDAALDEVRTVKAHLVASLRSLAGAVTTNLP